MIWHIFKKDWKLLWVFVMAVAFLHWIATVVFYKLGLFGEDPTLDLLAHWIPEVAFFGSMFLIGAIVHLEAIPGTRQDWLSRPIPRGRLLLEKFLFVVIMVQGPIFAGCLFEGLANGFSLQSSVLSAASYAVFLLFFLILPIFAFASVTKNMTEAFVLGCGCTFIIGTFLILAGIVNTAANGTLFGATHTGIGWVGEVFRFSLVTIAAGVILRLQYFRRKTALARFWIIAFGSMLLMSAFMPWKPAFAIEERLSTRPGAAATTEVTFVESREKFRSPSGLLAPAEGDQQRRGNNSAEIFLPLQIAGVGNDAILLVDRAEVHLVDQNKRVVYHGLGESFDVTRAEPKPSEPPVYQQIVLPMSTYRAAKDQLLRARIDYSLTLFGLTRSYSISALDGDERMPGLGWCKTKMNETGTAVEVRCMEPGAGLKCGSFFLENASSGARNPARSACLSEYSPFRGDVADNFAHFGLNLPFRDPTDLAKFPVDGPQLPHSRVIMRVYEPEDHFTRSLVIPQIKLKDWEAL